MNASPIRETLSITGIILALGLLPGCEKQQQADTRFISDSIQGEGFSCIEFSDGHTIKIECIRLNNEGEEKRLWDETLSPHTDGLGNTILIYADSEVRFLGRGKKLFDHIIPASEVRNIDHFTHGRNASLNPTNIVWVCMLNNSSEKIPQSAIPTLPNDLEDIAKVCRKFSADAIILRASQVSAAE